MESLKVFALTYLLAFLSQNCDALKCHQCNSLEDKECHDPMWIEPNQDEGIRLIKTEKFLQDCPDDGKEYTLCRKISQYVRGDAQVIRQCGFKESKYPCYTTVLEEYNTLVCQCNSDGCNGAQNLQLPFALFFASVLLAIFHQ